MIDIRTTHVGNFEISAISSLVLGGVSAFDVSADTSSVKNNTLARVKGKRIVRACNVRM